jgi:hypothetical protein
MECEMKVVQTTAKLFWCVMLLVSIASCGGTESQLTSAEDEQVEAPFWPTTKPGDPQLSSSHKLYRFYQAAQAKLLPANYFRDLIAANANIDIKYADWPRYQPGWSNGGTIYHPAVNKSLASWTTNDWSGFYNELFHAWWGNVFTKAAKYSVQRNQLLTNERRSHYRRANPSKPLLAQEEAYSETIATLMIYMHPKYNPNLPNQRGYMALSDYKYAIGKTVSPVSHGEQPGYTPEAESTYPNEMEYAIIFQLLTDVEPPRD